MRFENALGVVGDGTPLADEFAQIRIGGDLALFKALAALLLEAEREAAGPVADREFVDDSTCGFEEFAQQASEIEWDEVEEATGLAREQACRIAEMLISADLLGTHGGPLGDGSHPAQAGGGHDPRDRQRPAAARHDRRTGCRGAPVRGHSNVQGDRTMGIWAKMPEGFPATLEKEFAVPVPRRRGLDTSDTLRTLKAGDVEAFFAVGSNFAAATPHNEAALRDCDLTVRGSTKLDRSHVAPGRTALILPTLGRTERDAQGSGPQFITARAVRPLSGQRERPPGSLLFPGSVRTCPGVP